MRALLIEDNPQIAKAVQEGLTSQGFNVDHIATGFEGEEVAARDPYDIVLLDLMLPDRDGIDVCRNLRRRGIETPVLILTSLTNTHEKVAGLDAGADDYVTKPFELDELIARMRALLRRRGGGETTTLTYKDVTMDLVKRTVSRAGDAIKLTRKEFALLEYFLRNPDRVLTRIAIGQHVWDENFDPSSNVIDVYISMLRRKFDKPYDKPLIHTIVGTGYYFGTDAQA